MQQFAQSWLVFDIAKDLFTSAWIYSWDNCRSSCFRWWVECSRIARIAANYCWLMVHPDDVRL